MLEYLRREGRRVSSKFCFRLNSSDEGILVMTKSSSFSTGVKGPANERLVGTWKLVSASSTAPTGERSETPYGPSPTGFLTYGTNGRVTALISYGGRKGLSVGG